MVKNSGGIIRRKKKSEGNDKSQGNDKCTDSHSNKESNKGRRNKKGHMHRNIMGIILFLGLTVMVSPLFLLVSYSFMGSQELKEVCGAVLSGLKGMAGFRFFPAYPTLRAYVQLLLDSPEFFTAFWNSCIQVGGILLGQFLVAVPAAWAFAIFKFPGKGILWFFYMLLMILPFQVTMVSGYLVLNAIHLMDTFAAIILPEMFSTLPVFILKKSFAAIPREVIETAKVDGAGDFKIFLSIGLPLGKAGIFAILILGFLESWNAIEQPMTYLKTTAYWPLSLYLPQIMEKNAALAFVASMIMLAPALLLFFFGQDYLEQGIVASGLKG